MPYSRAWDSLFLKEFVVVHWDQRGSGKSFDQSVSRDTYNLEQVVSDGLRITEFLQKKFGQKQVILVGHSWGSIVAANMAVATPKSFRAYISVGTATDMLASEELRYALLKGKILESGNEEAKRRLKALGHPPFLTTSQSEEFGLLIVEFIGWKHTSYRYTMEQFIEAIGQSHDYTEADLSNAALGATIWAEAYGPTIAKYNAAIAVPSLKVPVYFAQGQFDLNTPTSLASDYFQALTAPEGKKWILFEHSAHFPMYDEPEKFLELLKEASAK